MANMNKTIGLIRIFQHVSTSSGVTIYKAFIRLYSNYSDIVFHQAFNNSFHQKIETVQYDNVLAIAEAMRRASKKKRYQELDLQVSDLQKMFRELSLFYKIIKNETPSYLTSHRPYIKHETLKMYL